MHPILRLSLVVLFIVAGALFVGPAPVSATPGNGAQEYNYSSCAIDFPNNTYCYTDVGRYNATLTPSGNYLFTTHGQSSYTLINPSGVVLFTDSRTYHYQGMDKDWVEHEYMNHSKFTYTEYGQTCTGGMTTHIVDGRLQFDRLSVSCV